MESGVNGVVRRVPQRAFFALLFTLIVVTIVLLLPTKQPSQESGIWNYDYNKIAYNNTYPLTQPIRNFTKICVFKFLFRYRKLYKISCRCCS